jgi:signal transduction histidine kinase
MGVCILCAPCSVPSCRERQGTTLRRLPLRSTLLLLTCGTTAAVLALAVWFAHREVRLSSRFAAEERLARLADQLADMATVSALQRHQLKLRAGREPALIALLQGREIADEAVLEALEPLRMPADSALPLEIRHADGRILFIDPPDRRPAEYGREPDPPLDSVPSYGSFFQQGGQVLYFSTTPVIDRTAVLGWIVQRRRIGSPNLAEKIHSLIGGDARVLFSYPGDSVWITVAGEAVAAPLLRPPLDSTITFVTADGERMLARARAVGTTPWSVLVEMPESAVRAGSGSFLERIAVAGLLLLLAATAVAWLLARRITRPIRELASASDAVAAGDFTRRVSASGGGEELERLAAAYNAMAEQVATSHDAMMRQLEEARTLARELDAARARAEEARANAQNADRAKSDFLATMSHEIRTPINAVLGFCDLLELEGIDDAQRADYRRRIRRAARRLGTLVEDVLDMAKVDGGHVRVDATTGSARHAVQHGVMLLEEEFRKKKLNLEVAVDANLAYHADPQRVEQIVLNLLANAVKFTPEGGSIRVHGVNGDAMLRIIIEDSGIGIDPAALERIFEPFVQGQSGYTREYGGTGLGLTISRRLARLMGGDLHARSEPGRGSRFTLLLPLAVPTVNART